jgi:hypothetical protein
LKKVFEVLGLNFPLSRAEHRRGGRIKARGLFESRRSQSEGGASFRALRPLQPADAASIVLAGKASGEARRTAIVRL